MNCLSAEVVGICSCRGNIPTVVTSVFNAPDGDASLILLTFLLLLPLFLEMLVVLVWLTLFVLLTSSQSLGFYDC